MSIGTFRKDASVLALETFIESNGIQKKLIMVLDTGSTYTMIPKEIVDILGLVPKETTQTITASGVVKASLVILKSVKVLGKEANNVSAIVHDLPENSYVDGLLGLSFLRNFELRLNFKEGTIELN